MAVNRYVVVKLLRGEKPLRVVKLFDKFAIWKYKMGKMNITAI